MVGPYEEKKISKRVNECEGSGHYIFNSPFQLSPQILPTWTDSVLIAGLEQSFDDVHIVSEHPNARLRYIGSQEFPWSEHFSFLR